MWCPQTESSWGQSKSSGQASHSCCYDGGGWWEAEITIDVILSRAPWLGQGAGPFGTHEQTRPCVHTWACAHSRPDSSAGCLEASGRPKMRWKMWVGPTFSQATWPQPHETPFKVSRTYQALSSLRACLCMGYSLCLHAPSPSGSSQKGLPASRAPTPTPPHSPCSSPCVSFSAL